MKPITALILSFAAGIATFGAQNYFFSPKLHAAPLVVPKGPDWRREMIEDYPGGAKVDHVLSRMTTKLDLSPEQASKFRPLLESQRERVLALLLTAPPTMTRDQFMVQRNAIWAETHERLDALLTRDQLEIRKELHGPANG